MKYDTLVGIRGATTASENTSQSIFNVTVELLTKLIEYNQLDKEKIVHVIFTVSPDITADFPAKAARIGLGWDRVPMICAQEIDVPLEIKYCIRILITTYSHLQRDQIKHIYLQNATKLRPDLSIIDEF